IVILLSVPIAANIGGSRLPDVQLPGTKYYWTTFGERYLLFLHFATRVTSSVVKWVVLTPTSYSFSPSSCLSTLLSISVYAAPFLVVPIHVATCRLLPTEADSRVVFEPHQLGCTQLHFESIETVIKKTWPWGSGMPCTGPVGCVFVHAAEGTSIVYTQYNAW
ncbi:hypothetical protein EDD16DRAFT_1442382, partial [Pisolithus croceorrhizus]